MLMKSFERFARRALAYVAPFLLVTILTNGCGTSDAPQLSTVPGRVSGKVVDIERFQPGDKISVVLTGITDLPPPHAEYIKDDGTITMPNIGAISVEGKTPGELQREIFNLYVPRIYTSNLNVNVSSEERFIYIGGEVKGPGRIVYTGDFTVTKAIQSAGDFSIFANQRNVRVTRPDGTIINVDCIKAMEDPSRDVPVFPGDKIYVKRRLF